MAGQVAAYVSPGGLHHRRGQREEEWKGGKLFSALSAGDSKRQVARRVKVFWDGKGRRADNMRDFARLQPPKPSPPRLHSLRLTGGVAEGGRGRTAKRGAAEVASAGARAGGAAEESAGGWGHRLVLLGGVRRTTAFAVLTARPSSPVRRRTELATSRHCR